MTKATILLGFHIVAYSRKYGIELDLDRPPSRLVADLHEALDDRARSIKSDLKAVREMLVSVSPASNGHADSIDPEVE